MSRLLPLWVAAAVFSGCSTSGLNAREPRVQSSQTVDSPPPAQPVDAEVPSPPEAPEEQAPPPAEDPVETPQPTSDQACYPGATRNWNACLGLGSFPSMGSDYDYPAPLSGSAQYQEPTRFLDLDSLDGSTLVAPNFRLDEVAHRFKGQYAVVQPHAIDRLQDLRDQLGPLIVNSGYRPPGYNASVGGAIHSRHMYGDAFDIDPVNVSLSTLQDTCYANGAGYVGVYATHIHCDWRNDPLSAEFFINSGATGFSYAPPQFDADLRFDGAQLDAPAEGWDEGQPLREWTAYDSSGWAIDTAVGEKYTPPANAASVEVWIGREIVRTVIF